MPKTKSQDEGLILPFLCPCGFQTNSLVESQDHKRAKDERCQI